MESIHRREVLLSWLRARGTTTAQDAASAFGVSTRTIMRDVAALRERGEPIESDSGRGGGLRVDPLRSLAPIQLRLEEIVELFLWVHLVRLSGDAPPAANTDAILGRLLQVIPAPRAQELRNTLRRVVAGRPPEPVRVPAPLVSSGLAPGVLSAVEACLVGRRALAAEVDGRPLVLELQGLLVDGSAWYAVGFVGREAGVWPLHALGEPRCLADHRVAHVPLLPLVRRLGVAEAFPRTA